MLSSCNFAQSQIIRAFGDSFTEGTGASDSSNFYPNRLSALWGVSIQNFGIGGQGSSEIATRLLADSDHRDYPTIIWIGRNNFYDSATVLYDIANCVSSLGHDRYLVIGLLNASEDPYESMGGDGYNMIIAINNRLYDLYGPHYVPVREILVAAYDPNLFWDSVCNARDVPPLSLRYDSTHPNDSGYYYIANKINDYKDVLLGTTSSPGFSFLTNQIHNELIKDQYNFKNHIVRSFNELKYYDSNNYYSLKTGIIEKKRLVFSSDPNFKSYLH